MEAGLQILFFTSTTILQIILIVAVVKGFGTLTVNSVKQEELMKGINGRKGYETESKNGVEEYVEEKEKQMRDLYRIPEGEELLFVKQVKLNKDNPITEINIAADGEAK